MQLFLAWGRERFLYEASRGGGFLQKMSDTPDIFGTEQQGKLVKDFANALASAHVCYLAKINTGGSFARYTFYSRNCCDGNKWKQKWLLASGYQVGK